VRSANAGVFTASCVGHVIVLLVVAALAIMLAARRLHKLLLS
jgi:tetrahydromethanopterin S-methyltransferase subunit B